MMRKASRWLDRGLSKLIGIPNEPAQQPEPSNALPPAHRRSSSLNTYLVCSPFLRLGLYWQSKGRSACFVPGIWSECEAELFLSTGAPKYFGTHETEWEVIKDLAVVHDCSNTSHSNDDKISVS